MTTWTGGGQTVEREGHPLVDLASVDQMEVVEHQHEIAGKRGEVVEERLKGEVKVRLWRQNGRHGGLAEVQHRRLQGGHDVGPEGHGIVVPAVER